MIIDGATWERNAPRSIAAVYFALSGEEFTRDIHEKLVQHFGVPIPLVRLELHAEVPFHFVN